SAASMFETVWSGRITCSRRVAAIASHATTTTLVRVHCVRGAKSPSHRRATARASPGTPVRNASNRTRRSCLRRLPRRSEVMPLEATVQRAAGEPERLRRFTHVAARAREGLLDEHSLDLLQTHLLQHRRAVARRAQGEVARPDDVTLGQEHRSLHRVVELAHVAGPGMHPEGLHRVRREARDPLAVARGMAAPEMAGEQRDVLRALAQRWEADLDGVEAKQE